MIVNVRVHLEIGGVRTLLGPYRRQLVGGAREHDLHDFVLDKVVKVLTTDVFSRELRRKLYFVSVKSGEGERGGEEGGQERDVEVVYDVYCVRAEPSAAGITSSGLVAKLRRVFGLPEVKEEALVSWKVSPMDQDEGERLPECRTGREDCGSPTGIR